MIFLSFSNANRVFFFSSASKTLQVVCGVIMRAASAIILLIAILAPSNGDNVCGDLYLTQSAIYKNRSLELNWDFTLCIKRPDSIALTRFYHDKAEILSAIAPTIPRGYFITNYTIANSDYPEFWQQHSDNSIANNYNNHTCFNYCASYLSNNSVVYSKCLCLQPTWMENFGELRIGDLMIPGTHNSGAFDAKLPKLVKNFALNQDMNLWTQLIYGIRFFDLRVGRYGKGPEGLYINHDFIKCTSLLKELESVRNFLEKSPREVVILNFHRFPRPKNFTDEYHFEILNLLENLFQDQIFPYSGRWFSRWFSSSKGPRIQEFWKSKKRVIISYNNEKFVKRKSWLWPEVNRNWGNYDNLKKLEEYIKMETDSPEKGNPMSVLMAEMTPSVSYIVHHYKKGLRYMASLVNRDLSFLLRRNNRAANLNVIATDYFASNDMINLAIETNFQKIK